MKLQSRKIVIIGAGHVGSHAGYALAAQGLAEHIMFIDLDAAKARAQAMDISDASLYLPHSVKVSAGDYSQAGDADLIIVSAGPLPDRSKGQNRMDTLGQTVAVMKDVIAKLKELKFDGIILNISNPADVITHYLQKGLNHPPRKILSTSTTLDSARLRRALSEAMGIDRKSILAHVLGEHGESQMVAWSAASVAGKPLRQLIAENPLYGGLDLEAIAKEARGGGWTVLEGKGSTEFGIASSIAEVVRALFGDEKRILPVSVLLDGEYGQKDVYASVPAVLGNNGVEMVLELSLSEEERKAFAASCASMRGNLQYALGL
ncbi:MAG: L-lactate dehydrogenase [Deltaproteobacteria bacterium]|jgi:L-lactate dehydrogenase|nr:L-lactate dehydrogenase [Deltaproteobacteria bacterium]